MTSSTKPPPLERFKQENYDNTFYYCQNGHDEFIAFTCVYCPLCELQKDAEEVATELDEAEERLDELEETHSALVLAVAKANPELLL